MARGWESKAVEDQINAAEAKEEQRAKESLSKARKSRRRRIEGLQQERTRLLRQIEEAHNGRYIALLQRALAHVEAELAAGDNQDIVSK